jgi:hypothetical protein
MCPESGYQAGSGEARIEQAAKASARLAYCFFLRLRNVQQRLAKWPSLSQSWQWTREKLDFVTEADGGLGFPLLMYFDLAVKE